MTSTLFLPLVCLLYCIFFMYQLKIANINPHNKKKVSIYHYYQYKYMGHPL